MGYNSKPKEMKTIKSLIALITLALLISCGGEKKKKDNGQDKANNEKEEVVKDDKSDGEVDMNDMSNKGIGPVKNVELGETIDQGLVKEGEAIFKSKCLACHRPHKKFVGPAPEGVLDRRSPEWVMNMILNPEVMTKEDPIARQLLIDHNGSPMANQDLTREEARKILEYFRTLDKS